MKQLVGRGALASCAMNSQQFGALYKFSSILPVIYNGDFFGATHCTEKSCFKRILYFVILNVQSLHIVSKSTGVF